ncbi:IS3 family transposase [Roseobacter weihaiensis]|uniref:IS3 family transposase n=1 Tax=Roseobacter weihaiensis TaxID=2763262 RepID=UPI0038736664
MHSRQKLATSERRTCRVLGVARSTLQYKAVSTDDEVLRLAMIRLANQYGRYGYRKVAELLRVEGWPPLGRFVPQIACRAVVNHKKIERLWREEGLQLPRRHKKRRRLYHKDSSIIRLRPQHPNHIWSVDFVHDKLSNGRPYKMLTALDEYTREALCVAVKPKMNSADVLDALYPLLLRRGKPEYIRSELPVEGAIGSSPMGDGSEFIATALQDWLRKVGIKPIQIYPGSPWENGYNERFNGTLRREVLNAEWFHTTKQAQIVINTWLRQYNRVRPHQALNMRPPIPETLRKSGP